MKSESNACSCLILQVLVHQLIKYPNLFKAAMINCPALDVATKRGGETPTDEELASLKNSPTAIWLVQGATDGTVNTEDCSKRLFKALTDGQILVPSADSGLLFNV